MANLFLLASVIVFLGGAPCQAKGHSESDSTKPTKEEIDGPHKIFPIKSQPELLQRGTEQAPVVIQLQKTDVDKKESDRSERQVDVQVAIQRGQLAAQEGQVSIAVVAVFFSFIAAVIAIWQAILFKTQLGYMKSALDDAKQASLIAQATANASQASAKAAEDSVKHAEATAKTQLRPYVSFSINLNEDHDPVPGQEYRLIFNCRNRGHTPAYEISFVGGIWCLPWTEKIAYPKLGDKLDEKRGNLFPGEGLEDRSLGFKANTHRRFTIEEQQSVRDGKSVYAIGLKIAYLDVFKDPHETEEWWLISFDNHRRQVSMVAGKSIIT